MQATDFDDRAIAAPPPLRQPALVRRLDTPSPGLPRPAGRNSPGTAVTSPSVTAAFRIPIYVTIPRLKSPTTSPAPPPLIAGKQWRRRSLALRPTIEIRPPRHTVIVMSKLWRKREIFLTEPRAGRCGSIRWPAGRGRNRWGVATIGGAGGAAKVVGKMWSRSVGSGKTSWPSGVEERYVRRRTGAQQRKEKLSHHKLFFQWKCFVFSKCTGFEQGKAPWINEKLSQWFEIATERQRFLKRNP